jgi:hypothetical protein
MRLSFLDAPQRSAPEGTSGTRPDWGHRQRRLKQGTCLTILLPLFHHPVSECSPSDGALRRESSGLAVVPSRSTWRRRENVTFEPQLEAGASDVVDSFAL